MLRCLEHKTELFIQTGMPPNVELGKTEGATVRFRLDSDPAIITIATKSTDGQALFLPDANELIRELASHQRMLFGFTPFNSPAVETAFDLDGLADAVQTLRAACVSNPEMN
jgi:type VI secretion system protein VasI